jgi:octaprenyl-diphosphate synthase
MVAQTICTMSEGELLAIQLSNSLEFTEECYYKIIFSKTASLIEVACKASALIYTDDTKIINALSVYGQNVGMGFQIKDDIFDYTSDNGTIGKPVGNDIKERQITLPLIYALNNADEKSKKDIINLIKKSDINADDIKQIVDFTENMKGIDYAKNKSKYFSNEAIKCLDIFPQSVIKDRLIHFAKYMIERNK